MAEIYLALIEQARLTEGLLDKIGNHSIWREVEIVIPETPTVIDYERKQSPHFWIEKVDELKKRGTAEIASHENPLVTPGAGAISVFYDANEKIRYVSFPQKDDKAPRDPGFRVPRGGFPNSEQDWYTNGHLYKEAYEEGIFVTRSGDELVLPEDNNYTDIIYRVADMLSSKKGLSIKGTKRVPIKFRDGYDILRVYRGNETKSRLVDKGAISWTPETGFNFDKVMEVQYPIEDLYLIDGETFPDGTLIGRDFCVIDIEHLKGKKFGDPISETLHRYGNGKVELIDRDDKFLTDKVPRSVLNQIRIDGEPVYPIDWMEESYEFLSNPDVLSNYSRFGWSALEKKLKVR